MLGAMTGNGLFREEDEITRDDLFCLGNASPKGPTDGPSRLGAMTGNGLFREEDGITRDNLFCLDNASPKGPTDGPSVLGARTTGNGLFRENDGITGDNLFTRSLGISSFVGVKCCRETCSSIGHNPEFNTLLSCPLAAIHICS
jgi:hypothetical protein